jgi:hypothetical protein
LARGGAFLSLPRSLLGFLVAGWTVDAHRMWGLVGQIGATANFGGRQNLYILKSCTTLLGLAMPSFFPAIWSISVYVFHRQCVHSLHQQLSLDASDKADVIQTSWRSLEKNLLSHD